MSKVCPLTVWRSLGRRPLVAPQRFFESRVAGKPRGRAGPLGPERGGSGEIFRCQTDVL